MSAGACSTATNRPLESLADTLAGEEALSQGRPEEALAYFNAAMQQDPNEAAALKGRMRAAYALQHWAEVLQYCAEWPTAEDPEIALMRGVAALRLGDTPTATAALQEAAAQGQTEAHLHLGLLLARQGRKRPRQRKAAIAHLKAVVEAWGQDAQSPDLDRVYFALGNLLGSEDETRGEAIAAFRKGLARNPLSPLGHDSLGTLLLREGQVLGALGEFKVAIQLDPAFPGPYTHLAQVFFHHIPPEDMEQEYAHILEDFGHLGPRVVARLASELVVLSREQAFRALYTKAHQLKNLMGMMGSKLVRLVRRLGGEELDGLMREQERLYDEWVGYLNTMHAERLDPTLVEPGKLARRVMDVIGGQDEKVRFDLRLQEGIPPLEADERLLREALTNLCLNAVEALRADGGRVVLGVGFDEDSGMVYFEVEDDGSGIEPGHIEHVFDAGFTTKQQGNGYGLSIARRIAHAHRGELRVKSRRGHGTVFRLDVPANFEAAAEPDALGGTHW